MYWRAHANEPIASADGRRDVRDFVAAWLTLFGRAAEIFERFKKERFYIVRLKPPCLRPFHLLAHAPHAACIHRIVCQCALLKQILHLLAVNGVGNSFKKPRPYLRSFAVANRFD